MKFATIFYTNYFAYLLSLPTNKSSADGFLLFVKKYGNLEERIYSIN